MREREWERERERDIGTSIVVRYSQPLQLFVGEFLALHCTPTDMANSTYGNDCWPQGCVCGQVKKSRGFGVLEYREGGRGMLGLVR